MANSVKPEGFAKGIQGGSGMEKARRFWWVLINFFVLAFLIAGHNVTAQAASGKTYAYLVGGIGELTDYDMDKMRKVFSANKLSDFGGEKNFFEYHFNVESKNKADYGTQDKFEKGFATAYKGITENDLAIFMYSGHGTIDSFSGNGLGLTFSRGKYDGKYYEYKRLAKKLSTIKCKKMIVIINSCGAGGFYKYGYKSLSSSLRKKIVIFLSSATDQKSYGTSLSKRGAYFIEYIAVGLGYNGGVVYADANADNQVTVEELANYVNMRTKAQGLDNIGDMNPEFYADHKKDVLYRYSGIRAKITAPNMYEGQKIRIAPSVSGIKDKTGIWKSSNPSVLSVNYRGAYGNLVAKKSGVATITYKINTTVATCSVIVKECKLKLTPTEQVLTEGDKIKINAKVEGPYSTVKWRSSNNAIATVNSKGVVTTKKTGIVSIIATANGKTAKCTLMIKKASKYDKKAQHKKYVSYIKAFHTKNFNAYMEWVYEGLVEPGSSEPITYFSFMDIDGDGIDECMVRFSFPSSSMTTIPLGSRTELYTIQGEKVKKVVEQAEYGSGRYPLVGVYKGDKLVQFETSSRKEFFTFKNGALGSRAAYSCEYVPGAYYVNGVKTTAAKFTAFLNKMTKGKVGYPMYRYSTANLNKFL